MTKALPVLLLAALATGAAQESQESSFTVQPGGNVVVKTGGVLVVGANDDDAASLVSPPPPPATPPLQPPPPSAPPGTPPVSWSDPGTVGALQGPYTGDGQNDYGYRSDGYAGLAVSSDGTTLVLADREAMAIQVIDQATGAKSKFFDSKFPSSYTGYGNIADGGPGDGSFGYPLGVAFHPGGSTKLYITDRTSNGCDGSALRMLDMTQNNGAGWLSTIVGQNINWNVAWNGPNHALSNLDAPLGADARLYCPWNVAVQPDASCLYIAESQGRIRRVDLSNGDYTVATFATFGGDGGAYTASVFTYPGLLPGAPEMRAVAVSNDGQFLYTADSSNGNGNGRLFKVNINDPTDQMLLGTNVGIGAPTSGSRQAILPTPDGNAVLVVYHGGHDYVIAYPTTVDAFTPFVYAGDPNTVSGMYKSRPEATGRGKLTVYGYVTKDGTGTAATFQGVYGIAMDPITNTIYVSESSASRVRKITPAFD